MLIVIISEGALRKWVLPGQVGNVAYFAKDALAVLFVIFNPIPKRNVWAQRARTALLATAVILIPWALVGLQISPLAAILTFKHIVIWPLFAIHGIAKAPKIRMDVIERVLLYAALLNAGLGFVQANSSAGAWVTKLAWQKFEGMENNVTDAGFGAGAYVRASGTFSYLSGLTTFSQLLVLFLLSRLSASKSWVPALGLIAGALCGVSTGSRGALGFAALALLAFPLLSRSTQTLKLSMLILGAGAILLSGPLRPMTEAFWERWQSTDESTETFAGRLTPDFGQALELVFYTPFGNGLGTESQWNSFERDSRGGNETAAEDRVVRLTSEIGAMAIPVVLILSLIPLRLLRISFHKSTHASVAALPILGLIYLILSGNAFFDHVAVALWWTALPLCAATLNADGALHQHNRAIWRPGESAKQGVYDHG